MTEPYYWHGYRMVACQISPENRTLRVHLQETGEMGGTLCGGLRMDIRDFDVATGWPDCAECLKKYQTPPPEKPSWQLQT